MCQSKTGFDGDSTERGNQRLPDSEEQPGHPSEGSGGEKDKMKNVLPNRI